MTAAEKTIESALVNQIKEVERKLKKLESNSFDSIVRKIDAVNKEYDVLYEELRVEFYEKNKAP